MDGTVVREVRFQLKYDRWLSPIGPSRHFAATQQFRRFRSEADIERATPTTLNL